MIKPPEFTSRSMGITLRTALLSWLVTITTLIVFVVFIVPQQKRTFIESLESKAHSVAVSLRDVAAGAAINEDYSSVVDHSKEMINGDSSLVYIIITRNDGFSLIHDREGWRAENEVGKEWRPDVRVPSGGIGNVSLFTQKVYHYSQPFDYSAIQWGWIHVGLSLDTYNRNVESLYRATLFVSLGCILLSLLASVVYAKRLVQPILVLRETVQEVARGDLSARAPIHRGDEIGALSVSFNSMTESLLRRDQILESVRFAAQQFLSTANWESVIQGVLAKLGAATDVSRITIYQFVESPPDRPRLTLRHFWASNARDVGRVIPPCAKIDPTEAGFSTWIDQLRRGEVIYATTAGLTGRARDSMEAYGICSIMVIPILVEGVWWGTFDLDECARVRDWNGAEQDSVRAAVDMLGAAIARQQAQDALVEAKEFLEQRVAERTRELVEQVHAKQQALAELDAAQQQLITTSRQAGMADVATGVLHNVGNVLNSVNVSSTLLSERLRESPARSLSRVADLLEQHQADMASYLTTDPQGLKAPEFIVKLARHLEAERQFLLEEHEQLNRNVGHIKEIVSMQQSYAKVSGFLQKVSVSEVLDDAVQINAAALERHQVTLRRTYEPGPIGTIDKHKVLQIVINLLQNAKYALSATTRSHKVLTISTDRTTPGRIRIIVHDNGVGIEPENLTRIFSHGFTTRRDGHGFGLHSGANFARELGGSLTAESAGLDCGATFTLELPIDPPTVVSTRDAPAPPVPPRTAG